MLSRWTGQRTQKMLNEVFTKFETRLDEKGSDIVKRIDDVTAATNSQAACQTESEARISALEDDTAPLMGKLAAVEKLNAELTAKATDLEGCSRPDNIRILNFKLKESVEGSDPLKFFEECIPKVLELPVTSITIDCAHQDSVRLRMVVLALLSSRSIAPETSPC